MSQKIDDVLSVAVEAERLAGNGRPGSIDLLRQEAIDTIARRRRVTPQTIQDACVRRLAPDVPSVSEFDRLLDAFLRGEPSRLKRVLERRRIDRDDEASIRDFFAARRDWSPSA